MRASYDDPQAHRSVMGVDLFDASKPPANRFHIVFCLDESGSMSGTKWAEVMASYNSLLQRRIDDQGLEDVVSVVTFDGSARVILSAAPIQKAIATSFSYRGGGTSFTPALQQAHTLLGLSPAGCTPLLVFMSDGQNQDGSSPIPWMQRMRSTYSARNLQVHTIAFQAGSGEAMLRQMAATGGGRFHACESGVSLAAAFVNIAAGCTVSDGLVQRFRWARGRGARGAQEGTGCDGREA